MIARSSGFRIKEIPINWTEKKGRRTPLKRLAKDIWLHGTGLLRCSGEFTSAENPDHKCPDKFKLQDSALTIKTSLVERTEIVDTATRSSRRDLLRPLASSQSAAMVHPYMRSQEVGEDSILWRSAMDTLKE